MICAEEAGAWTVVQPSGRGKNGDQVELGQDELNEELLVEVHNFQEPLAQGVVRASELLQVTPTDLLTCLIGLHDRTASGHLFAPAYA